jgi:hypothetical protein
LKLCFISILQFRLEKSSNLNETNIIKKAQEINKRNFPMDVMVICKKDYFVWNNFKPGQKMGGGPGAQVQDSFRVGYRVVKSGGWILLQVCENSEN